MAHAYFGQEFFAFLRQLKANNNREWFALNKARYVQVVEEPAREFIADLAPRLKAVSPRFKADARRVGGSLFRIYRDTRFSADKTPFKTHVAMRFSHDAKGATSVPGFYLHLAPADSMGGGGIYHSDPVSLRQIRQRIALAPREWRTVLSTGLEIRGDTLKRVPSGFAPDSEFADDLKRKDHYAMEQYTAAGVQSARFLDAYVETCESIAPLVRFLTGALGLRW